MAGRGQEAEGQSRPISSGKVALLGQLLSLSEEGKARDRRYHPLRMTTDDTTGTMAHCYCADGAHVVYLGTYLLGDGIPGASGAPSRKYVSPARLPGKWPREPALTVSASRATGRPGC